MTTRADLTSIDPSFGQPSRASSHLLHDPYEVPQAVLAAPTDEYPEEDEEESEDAEDNLDEEEDDEDYEGDDEGDDDVVVEDDEEEEEDENDDAAEEDDSDSVKKLMTHRTQRSRPGESRTIH